MKSAGPPWLKLSASADLGRLFRRKGDAVISGYLVKNRKIVVEQEPYTYSIQEGAEGVDILICHNRHLMLRLRQNWAEYWGIDLFRPKTVGNIIRYYRHKQPRSDLQFLSQERELFLELADLCFSPDEQAEKERFLEKCGNYADRLFPGDTKNR